ncbi:MAG: methylenetetrahydrofolate reductase [Deltaproteobacteria bacterium]|nr:methylenetetrahydrofolate reductase [Deltaproteobacteria bacterium]
MKDNFASKSRTYSFELFPPKTEQEYQKLLETIALLCKLNPDFISCTYGAGGGSREKTFDIVEHKHRRLRYQFRSRFNEGADLIIPICPVHLPKITNFLCCFDKFAQIVVSNGSHNYLLISFDQYSSGRTTNGTFAIKRNYSRLLPVLYAKWRNLSTCTSGYVCTHIPRLY